MINIKTGAVLSGLLLPLITQAEISDVTFTTQPTFTGSCVGVVQSGNYVLRNNTPVPLKLNYIRVHNSDGVLPDAAATVVAAPSSSCSTSTFLAAGTSCNILVNLLPLAGTAGKTFNRTLQVGVDTRQVQIDGTAFTSLISDCVVAAPEVPPDPVPSAEPGDTTPDEPVVFPPPVATLFQASIIGNSTITNTGPTVVTGDVDLGLPGTSITGFVEATPFAGPGTIVGTGAAVHIQPDAVATTADADAKAYRAASLALACPAANNLTGLDLGGRTLYPGTYCFDTSAFLTGALTLSGGPTSSYTFQIGSTLTTASNSSVVLSGGVTNNNVSWAIGSSATLGTGTAFQGIIDAVASITMILVHRCWEELGR